MKEAYYFQIKKYINSSKIALMGADILYGIFLIGFLIKKIFLREKTYRKLTKDEAISYLEEVFPFLDNKFECINSHIDSEIACSIIIPVYNHEDILEETIDSVVNQVCTYKYEVILVDDGSNEATKKILKKYELDEKCHVIYQDNQGIGSARNTGLNHAVGQYIMFVDCDDVVKNNIVQKLIDAAFSNNSDIVVGGYQLVKELDGEVIDVKDYIYPEKLMKNCTDENDIMSLPGLPWGKIYRKELFDKVRFIPGYWYEDTIVQFILYRECQKFTYVPEVLYKYKWHGNNFSNVQSAKANSKSVQRYWMLLLLIRLSKEIGLPEDATFYITLLRHLGSYYYHHVKDFDEDLQQAMFVSASELLREYKPAESYKMSFVLKQIEKGLLEQNYELWKLACQYQ